MWGQVSLPRNEDHENSTASIDAHIWQPTPPASSMLAKLVQMFVSDVRPAPEASNCAPSIALHPTRPLVAVTQPNVVTLFASNTAQTPPGLRQLAVVSKHRFHGSSIRTLAWSFESQITFLVGTTTGCFYCTLQNDDVDQSFEATKVLIQPIPSPALSSVDLISPSPQGRLFAFASKERQGAVGIFDAWIGEASPLISVHTKSLTGLHWLESVPCLVGMASGGDVFVINPINWTSDVYAITNGENLSSFSPVSKGNQVFSSVRESLEIFFLEILSTADERSVLLRQAPAMKTTLKTSELHCPVGSNLVIDQIACCSSGETLAVAFRCGDDIFGEVAVYVCSREQNALSVTFLRSITRGHARKESPSAPSVTPVRLAVGTATGRSSAKIVYILWSDQEFTFHVV